MLLLGQDEIGGTNFPFLGSIKRQGFVKHTVVTSLLFGITNSFIANSVEVFLFKETSLWWYFFLRFYL